MEPVPLMSMRDDALWCGDVIRLPFNYATGPGSAPVDLMVYDPIDVGCGLGVMTVTGGKAGRTLSIFPEASCPGGTRSLSLDWLRANWDTWFVYGHNELTPIPISQVVVLKNECYEIVPRKD